MSWALRDLKLLEVSRGLGFTKGMDSLDKDVAETSFLQYVTFCEQGQQKRWQSRFQPTEAKSWISTLLHCLVALHGNMAPTSKDATTDRLGDHKPKNLFETWLWQAWIAWIQQGYQIWMQNIYGEKSFESITDSQLIHPSWQCSSWIVTPDSINHPYQLSELLMSSMSLQRMVGMDSWNKTCRTRFFSAVRHI